MEERFISLLYPSEESMVYHSDRQNLPDISEDVCDELGLNEIFNLKNSSLTDFFTSDESVINYRQSTMRDLMNIPALRETLLRVHPVLDDILELRHLDLEASSSADSYLYSITEIELYVSCIDMLYEGLSPIKEKIESPAFKSLSDFICELSESDLANESIAAKYLRSTYVSYYWKRNGTRC